MPPSLSRELLHEKVAIVTGAGSGIGAASALRFADEGAQVLVADIRAHKADCTVTVARWSTRRARRP